MKILKKYPMMVLPIISLLISFMTYGQIPEQIHTYFGLYQSTYGNKLTIFLLPVLSLFLLMILGERNRAHHAQWISSISLFVAHLFILLVTMEGGII